MKKNKRKARVLALQVMYAADLRPGEDPEILFNDIAGTTAAGEENSAYARQLVRKARANAGSIDALMQHHADNWHIGRMAVIDRNILRLAVAELLYMDDVPFKVIIDEAVEIAKKYGADESGKFVNGVIDALYKHSQKK